MNKITNNEQIERLEKLLEPFTEEDLKCLADIGSKAYTEGLWKGTMVGLLETAGFLTLVVVLRALIKQLKK